MDDTDTVMVQPLTTYMEGAEHKSASSEPYGMPRWQAAELEALGHARILKGASEIPAAPNSEAEGTGIIASPATPAAEPEHDPVPVPDPVPEPEPVLTPAPDPALAPAPEAQPQPALSEEPAPETVAKTDEPAAKPTRGRGRRTV